MSKISAKKEEEEAARAEAAADKAAKAAARAEEALQKRVDAARLAFSGVLKTDSACKTALALPRPTAVPHCRPRTATPSLLITLSPRTACFNTPHVAAGLGGGGQGAQGSGWQEAGGGEGSRGAGRPATTPFLLLVHVRVAPITPKPRTRGFRCTVVARRRLRQP